MNKLKTFTTKLITLFAFTFLFNAPLLNAKIIDVDVNGLVCEFCAVTIEKIFMKKKDIIEKVDVDLEKKKVFLFFKDEKDLTNEEIENIIKNNGYNVVRINR